MPLADLPTADSEHLQSGDGRVEWAITLDRPSFAVGEAVTGVLALRNAGSEPMSVDRWNADDEVELVDSAGEPAPMVANWFVCGSGFQPNDDYVTLAPGVSASRPFAITTHLRAARYFRVEPGSYSVRLRPNRSGPRGLSTGASVALTITPALDTTLGFAAVQVAPANARGDLVMVQREGGQLELWSLAERRLVAHGALPNSDTIDPHNVELLASGHAVVLTRSNDGLHVFTPEGERFNSRIVSFTPTLANVQRLYVDRLGRLIVGVNGEGYRAVDVATGQHQPIDFNDSQAITRSVASAYSSELYLQLDDASKLDDRGGWHPRTRARSLPDLKPVWTAEVGGGAWFVGDEVVVAGNAGWTVALEEGGSVRERSAGPDLVILDARTGVEKRRVTLSE